MSEVERQLDIDAWIASAIETHRDGQEILCFWHTIGTGAEAYGSLIWQPMEIAG